MRAVSVGFVPKKWTRNEERAGYAVDFVEQELLEYSAVPVPANPEALLEAKSAGIDVAPMVEWAEKVLDGAAGEKGLWLPRKDVETLYSALKDGCKHISLPPDPKAVGDAAGGGDGKEVIATVRLYDDGTIDVVDMRNVREAMEDLSDAQKQILSVATKSEDDVTEKESVFDVERMAAEFGQVLERIEQLLKEKLPGGMNVNVIAEADDKTTDTNHADDGDDEYVFQLVEEGAGDKEDDEVNIDPEQLASVVREIVQEEFRRATGRLD